MLYIGIVKISLMIGKEGKMIKEKYEQLLLSLVFDGITTIGDTQTLAATQKKEYY